MGGPKASAPLAGRPLITHPIAAARRAGLDPLVVAKADSELPPLDCEVVIEPAGPVHPLAGIAAALERLEEPIVVLACDLPLVPPALLAELARREAELVVPADPRPQPLVARWSPGLLPRIRSSLATAEPLRRFVAEAEAEAIAGTELRALGDPTRMFVNVNDREGLARAEALIRGGSGASAG
jgi:molybdopterin-guanine dinucleotide biosynthesis protein A